MAEDLSKLSFDEYYKLYISAHKNPYNKLLHFLGTILTPFYIWFVIWLSLNVSWLGWGYLIFAPDFVRLFAWPGHWILEKNIPLGKYNRWKAKICDWKMAVDVVRGKIPLDGR